jgi:fucose 4-O-acetylase-like acetyltransferase
VQGRHYWADFARAVGITLVVYGHVARGLESAGIGPTGAATDIPVSIVYTFHMPLFFFLSGVFFLPSLQRHGPASLLRSRLDTLVWPYLLWSLLQGAVEVQLSAFKNDPTTWADVFALLSEPRAQFWFLYALFAIFLLVTPYFTAFPRRGLAFALPVGVAAWLWPELVPGITPLLLASQGLVFFLAGMLFAGHADTSRLAPLPIVLALLAAAVACQYGFHHVGLRSSDRGLALLLVALVSILAVVAGAARAQRRPSRFISLVSTSAMAIFVMHILTGSGARVLLQRGLGVESFPVHLVVGMAAGMLLPIAVAGVARWLGIRYLFDAPLSRLLPPWRGREDAGKA